MKTIKLTQGKIAIVDDEDFEELNKYKWQAFKGRYTYYASRGVFNGRNMGKIMMHRQIMNVNEKSVVIDHKDGNGLNNAKGNLRPCTQTENSRNRRSQVNTSSKYLGVCFEKESRKWLASIRLNGASKKIGRFKIEDDAARAYNAAAEKYFNEFANLNTII